MSNNQLFGRDWQVSIHGLIIKKPMRIQFHVEKSTGKEPNKLDLDVSNLSEDSRSLLSARGMNISLEAGYKDTRGVLFSGTSRICDSTHASADWTTHIECGDGETAFQYARFTKSFAAGASVADVANQIAKALTINTGNLDSALKDVLADSTKFTHGYSVHGSAFESLTKVLKSAGLVFSIQQGALLVHQPGQQGVQEVVVLSAKTGLLGSPEHNPPTKTNKVTTLVCRSLLNSKIRPGVILRMDSLQVKGDFVPQKVTHVGDSNGHVWETRVEAVASTQKVRTVQGI